MFENIALILFNILLFLPTVRCGLVVDDDVMVAKMKEKKKKFYIYRKNIKNFIKFIKLSTYGAGIANNNIQDHAITISLNIINTLLIYKVTNSFLCASLWLCNPINNQISIWLNGRRYAISIMFVLLGIIFKPLSILFLPISAWFHILSIPSFLLTGNLWISIFSLLGILLFGYNQHKKRFQTRKKDFSKDNELQKIHPKKAIVYIKTFGYYIKHIFFGMPKMYHKNFYYLGRYKKAAEKAYAFDSEFFQGLILFLFFVFEMSQGNFWAFWFVLFISQWCGVVTVTMNSADRYCSFPMIGLFMVFIKYISLLQPEFQIIIYSVFVSIWIFKYSRLWRAYLSLFNFYDYHLEINPADVEARVYYAEKLVNHEPFKALALINDGLKYMPYDFKLLTSMALLNGRLGRYDQVEPFLQRAEQVIPDGEQEDCKSEFSKIRQDINFNFLNRKQKRAVSKKMK